MNGNLGWVIWSRNCLLIFVLFLVQTPAAVSNINVSPSKRSAHVTWSIQTATQSSSYITQIIIYLDNKKYKNISRGTEVDITGLTSYTTYTVGIQTQDGSSQYSKMVNESFTTNEAGKCGDGFDKTCTIKVAPLPSVLS